MPRNVPFHWQGLSSHMLCSYLILIQLNAIVWRHHLMKWRSIIMGRTIYMVLRQRWPSQLLRHTTASLLAIIGLVLYMILRYWNKGTKILRLPSQASCRICCSPLWPSIAALGCPCRYGLYWSQICNSWFPSDYTNQEPSVSSGGAIQSGHRKS